MIELPDYKKLLEFTNAAFVAMTQELADMAVGIPLIWNQMGKSFQKGAHAMLNDAGILPLSGNDVPSIAKNFADKLKSSGLCQRVNALEATDTKLVIDIGECVLGQATQRLATLYPNMIPPCPMLAMLASEIDRITKKKSHIEACQYKPELNTRIFTLKFE